MDENIKLRRSVLSVPANREKMFNKAIGLSVDMIMLDLEDSVPIDEKEKARSQLVSYFQDPGWKGQLRGYRINDMETPFAYRDIIDVIEKVGNSVDVIVVPKVKTAEQIVAIDYLLMQIEKRMGLEKRIGLEASIEIAKGMLNIKEIAFSSSRLESLVFGVADYSASLNMWSKGISGHGEAEDFYPGHRWHYPLSRLNMAAKAAHLQSIDAPFGDLKDQEGLKNSCILSASLGFDGKWVIHPDQIEVINQIFSPSEEDVVRAKRILDAYQNAEGKEFGAISLDGKMLDAASIRVAKVIYKKWEQIQNI